MNALDQEETQSLLETFPAFSDLTYYSHKTSPHRNIEVTFPKWLITLTRGMVYFHRSNVMMDRNCRLMIKDLFLARFNTLLTMVGSKDYLDTLPQLLIDLYREGDFILKERGIRGYDVIKMLEPTASAQFVQLAEAFRPKIPHLGTFEQYILEAFRELSTELNLDLTKFKKVDRK